MKRIKLKRIGLIERVLNGSVATAFARALRSIISESVDGSNLQNYPEESTMPYLDDDEQKRIVLRMLDLERQKAEAINLARRRNYM